MEKKRNEEKAEKKNQGKTRKTRRMKEEGGKMYKSQRSVKMNKREYVRR